MDNEVFPTKNQVPTLIGDIVRENSVESLMPGEMTWVVPWAVRVDENGTVSVNTKMGERGGTPGGTVELKLISDFDGICVDATALSRETVERHFQPRRAGRGSGIVGDNEADYVPVIGVLYPHMRDTTGLNPRDVADFNRAQRTSRERFRDYFKKTYNRDYVFAEDEVDQSRMEDIGRPLGRSAVGGQTSRWGRRGSH